MVESEIEVLPICDEHRVGGIVSGTQIIARDGNPVGDAHHMPPRVTMGVGVNAEQSDIGGDKTGLLGELASGRVLCCLPVFDVPAWQRILTAEGQMFAANEQEPAAWIEDDAIDHQ